MELLLRHGAQIDRVTVVSPDSSALSLASTSSNFCLLTIFSLWPKRKVNDRILNYQYKRHPIGATALHLAASKGHLLAAEALVSYGAPMDAQDEVNASWPVFVWCCLLDTFSGCCI